MHDLRKALKSLAEILASHDVPMGFLFGAGTSCAVRVPKAGTTDTDPLIPAVAQLTAECKKHAEEDTGLGAKYAAAWNEIEKETKDLHSRTDIEAILSRVRQKREALATGPIHGLALEELKTLEDCICGYIASRVAPEEAVIPPHVPHDRFAQWIKPLSRKRPIEIFTTNYDVLIERSLENLRVPLFDGFVGSYRPYFDASVFDRDNAEVANSWVRLWKIHGSITWHQDEANNKAIYRGPVSKKGEMILPSHYKYDESRKMPYRAMQDRLGRILDVPGTALVTCGYSFSDDHINETILSHSDRSNATVFALMYGEIDENSPVVKLSENRPNFVVISANSGRYKGRFAEWSEDSLEACAGHTLLGKIVSDKKVCIGDFGAFTDLLARLSEDGLEGIK